MTKQISPIQKLIRLVDLLSEGIAQKTDEEVLSDLSERTDDVDRHVRELREVLQHRLEAKMDFSTGGPLEPAVSFRSESPFAAYKPVREFRGASTIAAKKSFVHWTNTSVLNFAQGLDPLERMSEKSEQLVMKALELGWDGPPYDPFKLAELLRIRVVPSAEIADARILGSAGHCLIEFNPRLPASRMRFSIAHEIAHTFFDDCLERARYRARRTTYTDDDWQLELLCNAGAAEILMPTGSFSSLRDEGFDIVRLMDLRKELGVSTEAILWRVVKLARCPIAFFVASLKGDRLRPEYVVASPAWDAKSIALPLDSLARRCTAIGVITAGSEEWRVGGEHLAMDVQAIGLPPYQGRQEFRVAGLVRPKSKKSSELPNIEYVVGDALKPRGSGRKVIAHVVNDATPRWAGGGFAAAVKRNWPDVQDDFKHWVFTSKANFSLGAIRVHEHTPDLSVLSMVAQHGYGPSDRPRIRYASLESCLRQLAEYAGEEDRSIHMPKIGTGHAAGKWTVIEELIEQLVCSKGLKVFIYQLK